MQEFSERLHRVILPAHSLLFFSRPLCNNNRSGHSYRQNRSNLGNKGNCRTTGNLGSKGNDRNIFILSNKGNRKNIVSLGNTGNLGN